MGCGASNSATSAVSTTPNLNNNPNINSASRHPPNAAGNSYTRSTNLQPHIILQIRERRIGSRPVIQSKSYRNGSIITQTELNNQRTEFWATRIDGNTHMWQAIQSAADAVLSNDLRLANAILEASNITTPNGLLEVCYDERGHQYKVPMYCIANPLELVQDSQSDRPNSDGTSEAEVVEDTSPPITVKVRINPGDYNMKVLVSSRGTILDLKKIVAKTAEKPCEEDRQRIMFMGKELKNIQKVADVGFEEAKVVQIFLRPQAK